MWISNIIYEADTTSLIAQHLPETVKYQSLLRRIPPLLNVTHYQNVTTMRHSGNGTSVENSSTYRHSTCHVSEN